MKLTACCILCAGGGVFIGGVLMAEPVPSTGLAAGIEQFEQRRYTEAVRSLKAAQPQSVKLADYVAYYLGAAKAELKDYAGARKDLAPVVAQPSPASPVVPKALLVDAGALVELSRSQDAVLLLRERYAELTQPLGDLALAQAYEAARDLAHAAEYYQRVYYGFPTTEASARASAALAGLRQKMGDDYPPATAQLRLGRAGKLLAVREYVRARAEYQTLTTELGGDDRELATVGIGAVDYLRKQTTAAFRYLQSLDLKSAEADAQRLYYVVECARGLDYGSEMRAALEKLAQQHSQSAWRRKALLSAANQYLLANQVEQYVPLYRACAETFAADPEAAYCHWKATWASYVHRKKEAAELLRDHLLRFPASTKASAALYFLGRLAENAKDNASAKAFYATITDRFPGHYYGLLARDRLSQSALVKAIPSPQSAQFLSQIAFPARRTSDSYEPTPATARHIERARLLSAAGLTALAEAELRYAAKTDSQPHLIGMEMARSAPVHKGLRYMKSFAPDYLSLPIDAAPQAFWEHLFPLPFRSDLVRSTRATALDPHVVAGLMRQESEFDPKAISVKKAYGLTQVMPSNGRQLARKAGMKTFSSNMLFQPATNLRLGTIYLRSLLDQWGGKWEETLASFNAGKSRVVNWLNWANYQEPAEFVETIPFTETRDYVQAVMRNAAMYRRLYETKLNVEETTPEPAAAPVIRKASAPAKKRSVRRTRG